MLFLIATLVTTVTAFGHGMSEADQHTALFWGSLECIKLGATHVLTGYDHLLFLFGVMFFITHFKDILKFTTTFNRHDPL